MGHERHCSLHLSQFALWRMRNDGVGIDATKIRNKSFCANEILVFSRADFPKLPQTELHPSPSCKPTCMANLQSPPRNNSFNFSAKAVYEPWHWLTLEGSVQRVSPNNHAVYLCGSHGRINAELRLNYEKYFYNRVGGKF